MKAWGDESIRMAADPPMYLLAASYFDISEPTDISSLEQIKPKSARKLHWMDMNTDLRKKSLAALSSIPMSHCIIVATPLNGRKQERARRKALEVLLPELEDRGISLLTLESRGPVNDKRDVELLLGMRRKHAITFIDITHMKGDEDSCLWVPDQLLGAYGDMLIGGHVKLDGPLMDRIEVLRAKT